jgi:hypothetical protein
MTETTWLMQRRLRPGIGVEKGRLYLIKNHS